MSQYKEIRLNLPFELRNMVEKVVIAYKRPKTKVIIELLWLLHDNPDLLTSKYPSAFNGKSLSQLNKAVREEKETDKEPVPSNKARMITPNFVITAEKAGRVPPQIINFIKYYAGKEPKYHFNLFYGTSTVRITAFGKSVEVDVKDEKAFHDARVSLPRALPFNSYYDEGTIIIPDHNTTMDGWTFEQAEQLMYSVETLMQDNDFHTSLDMAEAYVTK